ncbi:MAG: NADPH:quinone oxidoreductase [Pelagibacterales bacterium]|nr:NADPH:quinone oxidoreductase [Pelagibacterales bacterium]OUU61560.1 MAG: hypothetical protein CBC22_07270 [Alphaproteobacteria bacterium TMED62]|tara:strand:+ start:3424 stop:4398 length:975 start_codon:yes stop_codon:yes gene_type:complete
MYRVVVKKYGDPDTLEYIKADSERINNKSVKIRVHACGVNFADILTIKGRYQERPRPPFSPGLEISGKIIKVGKNVSNHKVGDLVMSIMKYGGYRSEVIVPSENTYKVPEKMPLTIAAGFPVTYGTAYSALVTKAKIKKGEICIILGATGGVGIAAIEIAKALGAKVIACGGDDTKLKSCKKKGADFVINYKKNILRNELARINAKEINVVIDMIGGQSCLDSIKSLKWNGRLVIVGFASGTIPDIPANRLLLKNASALGLYWGELAHRKPKEIGKDFLKLGNLYKKQLINPSNHKIFKLKNANKALNYLLERKNIGKIVLEVK